MVSKLLTSKIVERQYRPSSLYPNMDFLPPLEVIAPVFIDLTVPLIP